jgi:hypothetical protein
VVYCGEMEKEESSPNNANKGPKPETGLDSSSGVVAASPLPKGISNVPSDVGMIEWPKAKLSKLCSWAECPAGHTWKPTLALVDCPSCQGPSLMGKMENCPVCNEPTKRISLRHDYVPGGAGVAKRCEGQKPSGESVDIVLERSHWVEVEGKLA